MTCYNEFIELFNNSYNITNDNEQEYINSILRSL